MSRRNSERYRPSDDNKVEPILDHTFSRKIQHMKLSSDKLRYHYEEGLMVGKLFYLICENMYPLLRSGKRIWLLARDMEKLEHVFAGIAVGNTINVAWLLYRGSIHNTDFMRKITEQQGITSDDIIIDTGFQGSIPRALNGIGLAKEENTYLLSGNNSCYGHAITHQSYRDTALRLEHSPTCLNYVGENELAIASRLHGPERKQEIAWKLGFNYGFQFGQVKIQALKARYNHLQTEREINRYVSSGLARMQANAQRYIDSAKMRHMLKTKFGLSDKDLNNENLYVAYVYKSNYSNTVQWDYVRIPSFLNNISTHVARRVIQVGRRDSCNRAITWYKSLFSSSYGLRDMLKKPGLRATQWPEETFVCGLCEHEFTLDHKSDNFAMDICENCADTHYQCYGCGTWVHEQDAYSHNDEIYCDQCHCNIFISCSQCDNWINTENEDYSIVDGEVWCEHCVDNYAFYCEGCQEYHHTDESNSIQLAGEMNEWLTICDNCLEDYKECEHCNKYTYEGDIGETAQKLEDEYNLCVCNDCANGYEFCEKCDSAYHPDYDNIHTVKYENDTHGLSECCSDCAEKENLTEYNLHSEQYDQPLIPF